jgi:hypothetical protein
MKLLPSLLCALAIGCGPSFGGSEGDTDGDTISDADESADQQADSDQDGTPDYRDVDSDNDCIPDRLEAGDADLDTSPIDSDNDGLADFRDVDSDGDGLPDRDEDTNCDGVLDPGESSARDPDTDDDGVSDLVEFAAGTDPRDPADNPQARGDFVFVVPYEDDPIPAEDDLNFGTDIQIADVYVLADLSGSMSDELSSIRNNFDTVLSNLTCPPLGTGTPGSCIRDLWSGLGTFTYAGRNPFEHRVDIQPNPSVISGNMPGSDNGSCPSSGCVEPHLLAAYSAVTGQGSSGAGCPNTDFYQERFSCTGSPAGPDGVGYPCFRKDALPVVLLATDEPPSTQYSCPGFGSLGMAASGIGAKIIGIRGDPDGGESQLIADLSTIATSTGAVDQNNQPLVFKGYNSGAATAIEDGVRTLVGGIPLTVSGHPTDDPSDSVDAVASFVDHIETLQLGTPECQSGLPEQDTDGDGYADVFTQVVAGTPVCWKVVARSNTDVPGTDSPTVYQATLDVYGDGVTLLDQRRIFFVVPPLTPSVE